jgi:phosphoglucosamine mutase
MEEMLRRGLSLGGEQSGHVIFADYLFTGDGLATALSVLRVMATSGRSLADLASEMTAYPQVLMNLRVKERVDLRTVPAVAAVLQLVESRLEAAAGCSCAYPGPDRSCA